MPQSTLYGQKNKQLEEEQEDIYFDQTSRYMGSVNKNFLNDDEESMVRTKNHPSTRKGMPASTFIDYSLKSV